jgi:hypothetical protein
MSTSKRLTVMFTGAPTSLELAAVEDAFGTAGFGDVTREMHAEPVGLKMAVAGPTLEIKSSPAAFELRRSDFAKALGAVRTSLPEFGLMLLLAAGDRRSMFAWKRIQTSTEVVESIGALPADRTGTYGWDSATSSWIPV